MSKIRTSMNEHIAELRATLNLKFEAFAKLGTVTNHGPTKWHSYNRTIYIDRGSPVLGVAHLDSVQHPSTVHVSKNKLHSSTIDNRLGAWLLLYELPRQGIFTDVLLTEHEESGQSTGQFFTTDKQYNWMVSFDRGGDDVVAYRYHCDELSDRLWEAGMLLDYGIYSDINDIDIGVKGMNWGCGMQRYHSPNAYADLDILDYMLDGFKKFWSAHRYTHMPHTLDDEFSIWDTYEFNRYPSVTVYDYSKPAVKVNGYDIEDPGISDALDLDYPLYCELCDKPIARSLAVFRWDVPLCMDCIELIESGAFQ